MTAYLPGQQANNAVEFFLAVVDALQQRSSVLDRITGAAGIALDQLLRRDVSRRTRRSDKASAGLTRPCGKRSKTRRSPTVEK